MSAGVNSHNGRPNHSRTDTNPLVSIEIVRRPQPRRRPRENEARKQVLLERLDLLRAHR